MAQSDSIAMRKDLVEKYKIDTSKLKTLQDLEPILKAIKEKEPTMTPYHFGQDAKSTIAGTPRILGADPLGDMYGILMNDQDATLKVTNYYETPEYKSLLELARKWYKAGYVSPSAATQTETAQALVKAGKLFGYLQAWKPGIDSQVNKQCSQPMMTVQIDQATATTGGVTSFGWVMPNYTKNPERAMMFLNMMYSDASIVNLIDWGIENKHYVKQADGTIDFPSGTTNENNAYAMNSGFVFGNQLISYIFKGDDPTLWKQMGDFNKSARLSKALGFMFNATSVKTEYAAVTNVFNEYQRPLETGSIDPATKLPEFISKLKAAGLDKIIAEKQKQIDEWGKAKGVK
jgi:putative aldouronate transport system substrate-binding protein